MNRKANFFTKRMDSNWFVIWIELIRIANRNALVVGTLKQCIGHNGLTAITAQILCIGAERRGAPNGAVHRCTILSPLFPSFLYNTILFSICRNCLYDINSLYMGQSSNDTRDTLRRCTFRGRYFSSQNRRKRDRIFLSETSLVILTDLWRNGS